MYENGPVKTYKWLLISKQWQKSVLKHNRQQLEPIKQRWLRRSKEGLYVQGQILIQHLA